MGVLFVLCYDWGSGPRLERESGILWIVVMIVFKWCFFTGDGIFPFGQCNAAIGVAKETKV